MIYTRILIWLVFAGTAWAAYGQNVLNDLTIFRQKMYQAVYFSSDITVTGYKTKNDKTGLMLGKGMVRKSKDGYYSKFGETEVICNNKYLLTVDNNEKSMRLTDYSQLFPSQKQQILPDLDSIFRSYDSIRYVGLQGNARDYVIYSKRSGYQEVHMIIDKNLSVLQQIIYVYPAASKENTFDIYKIVVNYRNTTIKPFQNNFIQLSKYLVLQKNKADLNKGYKNYKLIII